MLCFNDSGQIVEVSGAPVGLRPAVYGILIENDQVLLQPHEQSGLWQPPGKVLEEGETPAAAVLRCFQATAGILPLITGLLFAEERCWQDGEGRLWQLSVLYYGLKRPTAGVAGMINFDSAARPEWFPLENLKREEMLLGFEAVEAGRVRQELTLP